MTFNKKMSLPVEKAKRLARSPVSSLIPFVDVPECYSLCVATISGFYVFVLPFKVCYRVIPSAIFALFTAG